MNFSFFWRRVPHTHRVDRGTGNDFHCRRCRQWLYFSLDLKVSC